MIGVDTQILVYSQRGDSPWQKAALGCVRELAEGNAAWAIPSPCLQEFLAIVTHPRIYRPPTSLKDALTQIEYWFQSPTLVLIGEAPRHWEHLKTLIQEGQAAGPIVHDARVAAICEAHGVLEFWSVDCDFSRFPRLRVSNPLVGRS